MHEPPSYLAFDLGASSSRAVLGTLEGDEMRLNELYRFDTPIIEEKDHLFWDVESLWNELQAGFRAAQRASSNLRSLSVDSWSLDYVPLDASGNPIRNPFCYRDPRTEGVMERAFEIVPATSIYEQTGIQFLPFNTLYQVIADRAQNPDGLKHVAQHLSVADYFNYRFGGRAVMDVSMASATQMMDVRTRQWAEPLMRAFGLDPRKWPVIVPSGTLLGRVREAPGVTVVTSCSHDTGSAVAATPAMSWQTNWAYVSCGTWSLLGVERMQPLLTEEAREAGFTHEAGIDGTIRFLKNLTGLWVLQECVREWRAQGASVSWAELEAEADAAAPNGELIDLEHPRFVRRGGMEERIRTYCREQGHAVPVSRGEVARNILESIAASYHRALTDLERVTGQPVETVYLVGGGSQNALLCRLTAAACAKTVVAGPAEATALGNVLIQARTMQDLPDGVSIRDAAARSSLLQTYVPSQQTA